MLTGFVTSCVETALKHANEGQIKRRIYVAGKRKQLLDDLEERREC
jgi:hypothetical protein